MKKFLALISITMFLFLSCQTSQETNTQDVVSSISYFRDSTTGLCFAAVNSVSYPGITSITCVPCDSLKKLKYGKIN